MIACNKINVVVPPQNPAEFAQITYLYNLNDRGGGDFAFLVERLEEREVSFTFPDDPLTLDYLNQKVTSNPISGFEVFATDASGLITHPGYTDKGGHAAL